MKITVLFNSTEYEFVFERMDKQRSIPPEPTLRKVFLASLIHYNFDLELVKKYLNKKKMNLEVTSIDWHSIV